MSNEDAKTTKINQMLELIMNSSQKMPDCVFHNFIDNNADLKQKPFYNLIADSFLTLFAYCKLMRECAWSQAFALLRIGIEQVAAVFVLCNISGALDQYLCMYLEKCKFVKLTTKDERRQYCKSKGIKPNRINDYLDYGWISNFTFDHTYGRNQMIQLARLDEFLVDIEETLNAFAHGSLSVFQMSKDNWRLMKDYGRRACLACCKLYDYLCCSYHILIGDNEFRKMPLNNSFITFKNIWHTFFTEEG